MKYTLIEDEFECEIQDENFFLDLQSGYFNKIQSSYPMKPDFPSRREDASWYVSSCGLWGCWIINKSKKKLTSVSAEVEKGWNQLVYKYPYPLHDHKSSLSSF